MSKEAISICKGVSISFYNSFEEYHLSGIIFFCKTPKFVSVVAVTARHNRDKLLPYQRGCWGKVAAFEMC
jgi:hypothetical protein